MQADLESGTLAPVAAKRLLARTVVDLYHGEGAGVAAEAEFDRVFKAHEVPADMPVYILSDGDLRDDRIQLARLLAQAGLVSSNAEGRRKIQEKAVRVNDELVTDPTAEWSADALDGAAVQVGRRSWARVRRAR